MKIHFALLVLSLSLPSAFGAAKERALASDGKMDFSLKSPQVQRIDGADALPFYSSLLALEGMEGEDDLNLAEYRRLEKYLEEKGFRPREQSAKGGYLVIPRFVLLRRLKDEKVKAANGRPAYTGLAFDFDYSQRYQKPGEPDKAAYPALDLRGTLFFRCYGSEECRFSTAAIRESALSWQIPAVARGAESSAGGVKPKE